MLSASGKGPQFFHLVELVVTRGVSQPIEPAARSAIGTEIEAVESPHHALAAGHLNGHLLNRYFLFAFWQGDAIEARPPLVGCIDSSFVIHRKTDPRTLGAGDVVDHFHLEAFRVTKRVVGYARWPGFATTSFSEHVTPWPVSHFTHHDGLLSGDQSFRHPLGGFPGKILWVPRGESPGIIGHDGELPAIVKSDLQLQDETGRSTRVTSHRRNYVPTFLHQVLHIHRYRTIPIVAGVSQLAV